MCIIAVCYDRKLTTEEIVNCWQSNSDGAGVAWMENGKNYFSKGFMHLKDFGAFYSRLFVLPHVVHFRIGTSGATIPELTHPFICKPESPLRLQWKGTAPLLFHNGVLYDYEYLAELMGISAKGPEFNRFWSDTRVIATAVPEWGHGFLKDENGKYVILLDGTIHTYGWFFEEKGVNFSNYGFRRYYGGYKVATSQADLIGNSWEKGGNVCNNGNEQGIASNRQIVPANDGDLTNSGDPFESPLEQD